MTNHDEGNTMSDEDHCDCLAGSLRDVADLLHKIADGYDEAGVQSDTGFDLNVVGIPKQVFDALPESDVPDRLETCAHPDCEDLVWVRDYAYCKGVVFVTAPYENRETRRRRKSTHAHR